MNSLAYYMIRQQLPVVTLAVARASTAHRHLAVSSHEGRVIALRPLCWVPIHVRRRTLRLKSNLIMPATNWDWDSCSLHTTVLAKYYHAR